MQNAAAQQAGKRQEQALASTCRRTFFAQLYSASALKSAKNKRDMQALRLDRLAALPLTLPEASQRQ